MAWPARQRCRSRLSARNGEEAQDSIHPIQAGPISSTEPPKNRSDLEAAEANEGIIMTLSRGKTIAITGAGNADTTCSVITSVNLALSAAATVNLRETSGAGAIIAQRVLAAAGPVSWTFLDGIRCKSGNWFIENSAGNVTGGVTGY